MLLVGSWAGPNVRERMLGLKSEGGAFVSVLLFPLRRQPSSEPQCFPL